MTRSPAARRAAQALLQRDLVRRQVAARARAAGYTGGSERLRDIDHWAVLTAKSTGTTFFRQAAAASIHRYIESLR